MKKVININFHSRVIPIEETAYDILKKYVDKLRRHFAGEEGGDEIVNDIENRFAELFSDKLKAGAVCITDEDVNAIIISMGNPEDFDQEEGSYTGQAKTGTGQTEYANADTGGRGNLNRSLNDKILGGVCGGLAAYMNIDPSLVRIGYALLSLASFGFGFLLYVILWAVLPVKATTATARKRLYRNPDQRVIGGVASGIAAYFHTQVWIPRIIFALPLIAGLFEAIFNHGWFHWGDGPHFITGGFGGTLFVAYLLLWMLVPEAQTATEKLEMRGEKIDIESIKNTIMKDFGGIKQRAAVVGEELKQRAQEFSDDVKKKGPEFRSEMTRVRKSNGIGHAIGVLFRAFFLFIGITIAFALVVGLIAVIFGGAAVFPLKNYFLQGFWEHLMAWSVFLLVLCVPVIGLFTFFIRRIIGVRAKNNSLGYIFGGLWVLGLMCAFILLGQLTSNFRMRMGSGDDINLTTPPNGKLIVQVKQDKTDVFNRSWLGINFDSDDGPFYNIGEDSIMANTVRIVIQKSDDSSFHVHREKFSRGSNADEAKKLAEQINFNVTQQDSLLFLSEGFAIYPKQQFRNQQVLVLIQVPVGKKIYVDESADDYNYFNINVSRNHRRWSNNDYEQWDESHNWESGIEYVMTTNGLEKTGLHFSPERKEKIEKQERDEKQEQQEKKEDEDDNKDDDKKTQSAPARKEDSGYRYHQDKPSARVQVTEPKDEANGSLFEIFAKEI